MVDIFEVRTKDGKLIRLTEKQWSHIKHRHSEMVAKIGDIENTISNPTVIVQYSDETTKFYKFMKDEKNYIMVAVKILDDEGFVITAYKTKRI